MTNKLTRAMAVAILLALAPVTGCVSTGSTGTGLFSVKQRDYTVYLGKTTEQDVIGMFGNRPWQAYQQVWDDGVPRTTWVWRSKDLPGPITLTVCQENGVCITNSTATLNRTYFTFRKGVLVDAL